MPSKRTTHSRPKRFPHDLPGERFRSEPVDEQKRRPAPMKEPTGA
jgi:hypothetical protein